MTDEIKAIIEKNLPAQVGDSLKLVLEQGKKDSETVKQQKEQIEKLLKTLQEKEELILTYKKFDERNSALEAREKACEMQERDLKVKTLEYQLEAEKSKTVFSQNVALGLVRNTEYRRDLFDSVSSPQLDQYGNIIYANKTQNSTETKKAE